MLLEILTAIICGILCGVATGLVPGIHVNLVAVMLISVSPLLLQFTSPVVLAVFIIALATTHTFIDFIPSVFLGVPDAETALSVLPGHKLVLLGQGYEAVKLATVGSMIAVVISALIFPLMILIVPFIYSTISDYVGWILLLVVSVLILKEKGKNRKFWSLFIFLISGILGYIVLNIKVLSEPLFPLLGGLFGTSMLINSLFEKSSLPWQRVTEQIEVNKTTTAKAGFAATVAGGMTGILPGIGAAQASVIGSAIVGGMEKIGIPGFLILQGGINTVNFVLSLVALYTLGKARNGAVVTVMRFISEINVYQLMTFIAVALVVGGIATIVALALAKKFAVWVRKVNYQVMCLGVILLIVVMVFLFSGFLGLLILFVSTMTGLIPMRLGIAKNHMMGCIILPVIIYFLL